MSNRPLTIITGASRGLGAALAEQLATAGHDLLCVSRRTHPSLNEHSSASGGTVEQWTQDLVRGDETSARLETWLDNRGNDAKSVTLINNAAIMPRIALLADVPGADLMQAMRVDLEAPMLLTSAFLRATTAWSCKRKVLNISSGLGRRTMVAHATYCAAKAGLDHFTRCIAKEQELEPNGARVCALAPGVVDTLMQEELRTESVRFPNAGHFAELHQDRALVSPADSAAQILTYLNSPDFGNEPVTDIRNLYASDK